MRQELHNALALVDARIASAEVPTPLQFRRSTITSSQRKPNSRARGARVLLLSGHCATSS
eukprot:5650893-Pyramimonas_sp.AAC.1